ncbi:hypothetical protein OG884_18330 [Streptosporangium sp. NBC_01755]|uniref:hypothetical protein n=1 Tax=Streptosporangium sp. NBC_01755 TaxID=2975949 RepID=UPI002DDC52C2|nr:hypothetical protein [Streptosporangium sp. NBC_01755]WSD03764.1 hypothetical protein OG884_18330 [Streptosporangium sp. NBC_01755]
MNHDEDEDAMSAYLAQGEPHPIPVARDPRNPAEDEMTPQDEETYEQEKNT